MSGTVLAIELYNINNMNINHNVGYETDYAWTKVKLRKETRIYTKNQLINRGYLPKIRKKTC